MTEVLTCVGLTMHFGASRVLTDVNLALHRGEIVSLMGPSGSGKSTLLHCLAGLLRPDHGRVLLDGHRIDHLADRQRSRIRLSRMGFVFQFGDLVSELTLAENVELPLRLLGVSRHEAADRAARMMAELGLVQVARHRLNEVSGGEAQRAAVARALVTAPDVVLADEPTGSLDTTTGELVLESLVEVAAERQTTVLLVTHEHRVAAYAHRTVSLVDGTIRAPTGAR